MKDSFWLFDTGEGTQVQLQRCMVRPALVDKIFVTHAHGDHTFGLPGLLCLIARARKPDAPPLEIYGTFGLGLRLGLGLGLGSGSGSGSGSAPGSALERSMVCQRGSRAPRSPPRSPPGLPLTRARLLALSPTGPAGLRAFLRVALAFTGTKMLPRYLVHEMHQIPTARGSGPYRAPPPAAAAATAHSAAAQTAALSAQTAALYNPPSYLRAHGLWGAEDFGEQPGGRDLRPAEDGVSWWGLLDEEGWSVRAAPLAHTAPCVGFVVEEAGKPGRLMPEVALPPLEANRAALREEWGVRDPRALLKRLAALGPGERLELPDGTSLAAEDVQSPPRRGRKIAILGDCSDCSLMVRPYLSRLPHDPRPTRPRPELRPQPRPRPQPHA